MVKVPPLVAPHGSRASSGHSQEEACPLGAQRLPQVLERTASKPADFPALTTQALNSTGKWCHVVDEATNVVFTDTAWNEATNDCYDAGVKVRGHPSSPNPNPEPEPSPGPSPSPSPSPAPTPDTQPLTPNP